jgi:succinate dehydrogenase / fumarate reductase cytochrome b subunit
VDSQSGSFFSRHQFLILRLHSLSGLLPVGAYMCVHLLTNATTLGGAEMFQRNVDLIHSLGPFLPIVEWTFIFLPILFHAVVGVMIVQSGTVNYGSYRYMGNFRYTMQRATAYIALVFILYHVFHMHGWFHNPTYLKDVAEPLGGHQFDPHRATSTAAVALSSPLKLGLYLIGVLSCIFHFANGLWTMGITWGVWTSAAAQKRANYLCAAIVIGLTVVSLGAFVGVRKTDIKAAEAYEQAHIEAHDAELKRAAELEASKKKEQAAAAPAATATKK